VKQCIIPLFFTELRRDFATMQLLPSSAQPLKRDRFILPYQRNEHFTGRQDLLTAIYKKLCQALPNHHNHRVALHGLGGVGKTQLALEYAYTRQAHYDGIYWISAVNQITILAGFRDIAKRSNCLPDESNLDSCEKDVISWLNQQDRWLLIFDNLNDATVIDGYLPNASYRKHILFTTRNPNSDEIPAEGLEIGVLDLKDAVDLVSLCSKINVKDTPERKLEAERIVRELGFLPLAIEQAGSYIREVSKDIFKFLPSYRKNRQKYHQRVPRGNWKYQKSVATTWRLSFEEIEQTNGAAAQLLRLLSFLNPDVILTDFLEAGSNGLATALNSIITDSDTFYEALSDLERWSIIRREEDELGEQRITIHRLVQSVIKDEMSENDFGFFTTAVISLCDRAFPLHITSNDARMICRRYQAQVVIPLSGIPATNSTVQLEVLERIAWFLHDDGKYAQSRELRSRTVDMCVLLRGQGHRDTLLARGSLALTFRREGRLKEAATLQVEVMEAMERLLGAEHPDTLRIMSELALTYLYQGRCDDAFRLHERALEGRKKLLGEDHPDTLTAMSRLAATYRDQERWDNAISLHETVLCARRRLLGDEHPDTLMAMSSLAYSYTGSLRWDDARSLLERVLEARTRLLGEEHMDTLVAMSRLGYACSGQRQWNNALRFQNKALESLKGLCGDEHRDTLTAMTWLASTYWGMDKGKRETAVALYEKVLSVRKKTLGDKHPTTLRIASILQDIYQRQGQ
jgi:tetratricopeptide (TPR) repeat protein